MNRVLRLDYGRKELSCGCVVVTGGGGYRCAEAERLRWAKLARLTPETAAAYRDHLHPEEAGERMQSVGEILADGMRETR